MTRSRVNRSHLNRSWVCFGQAARYGATGMADFGRVQGSHQTCAFRICRYSSTETTTSVRVIMKAMATP